MISYSTVTSRRSNEFISIRRRSSSMFKLGGPLTDYEINV